MENNCFVFRKEYYDLLKCLEGKTNEYVNMLHAIVEYGLFRKQPKFNNPVYEGIFSIIRDRIDEEKVIMQRKETLSFEDMKKKLVGRRFIYDEYHKGEQQRMENFIIGNVNPDEEGVVLISEKDESHFHFVSWQVLYHLLTFRKATDDVMEYAQYILF